MFVVVGSPSDCALSCDEYAFRWFAIGIGVLLCLVVCFVFFVL